MAKFRFGAAGFVLTMVALGLFVILFGAHPRLTT